MLGFEICVVQGKLLSAACLVFACLCHIPMAVVAVGRCFKTFIYVRVCMSDIAAQAVIEPLLCKPLLRTEEIRKEAQPEGSA